jgi:hypothetical protein
MTNDMRATFDECMLDNHNFFTHAYVIVAPYVAAFKEKAQENNRIIGDPKSVLPPLGYVHIDDTCFSNGQAPYKFSYNGALSSVYIRPYVYTLWQAYRMSAHRRPKFASFLRELINTHESSRDPLLTNWEKYQTIPPAPRRISTKEIDDIVQELIDDPHYEFATPYYLCQTPLTRVFADRFNMPMYSPFAKGAADRLGYVKLKNIPELAMRAALDGTTHMPPAFGDKFRGKTVVYFNPVATNFWRRDFSISQFVHHLFRKSQHEEAQVA